MPKEFEFDFHVLEGGYRWSDILDFLEIPHYTNEHRGDRAALYTEIRTVSLPDLDFDEDNDPIQLLVVWPLDKQRPTDEQIRELWMENRA